MDVEQITLSCDSSRALPTTASKSNTLVAAASSYLMQYTEIIAEPALLPQFTKFIVAVELAPASCAATRESQSKLSTATRA